MKALDKKLIHDLSRLRGQIIAIALVVACGIASFVSMLSAYESLKLSLRYEAGTSVVAGAIFISLGAAVIGAFMAVQKAVSLPPAEAMRAEPFRTVPARLRQN